MAADGPAMVRSLGVSRETIERLEVYAVLLQKWQLRMNLVSNSTMAHVWTRHFADSLQLMELAPKARIWVDMGSGAGFPGLPIAIHLLTVDEGLVHLIERDNRKCAFLREVARETGARAMVHHGAVEDILPTLKCVDVVTSRAVASLDLLLEWSLPLLELGAIGLFPKGQDVADELTKISRYSNLIIKTSHSRTGSEGHVVVVSCAAG